MSGAHGASAEFCNKGWGGKGRQREGLWHWWTRQREDESEPGRERASEREKPSIIQGGVRACGVRCGVRCCDFVGFPGPLPAAAECQACFIFFPRRLMPLFSLLNLILNSAVFVEKRIIFGHVRFFFYGLSDFQRLVSHHHLPPLDSQLTTSHFCKFCRIRPCRWDKLVVRNGAETCQHDSFKAHGKKCIQK